MFFHNPRSIKVCGLAWLCLSLALAGWLLWPGTSPSPATAAARPVVYRAAPATRAIEQLRVGDRVLTDVPKEVQETDFLGNVDEELPTPDAAPREYRLLSLEAVNVWADGTRDEFKIETLQHVAWLSANSIEVGGPAPIPLDLVEMGIPDELEAVVASILPCPAIKKGTGRIVLTTVSHLNNDVWEIEVRDQAGRSETIRPTGLHKFYSASQKGAVSTCDLQPGEVVLGTAGPATVVSSRKLPGTQLVYNMTVQGEHVYRVSKLGVLVHNNGCAASRFTGDQQALVALAKEAKVNGRVKPISQHEAQILREFADEVGLPFRGPEVHPNRPYGQFPHIHVGPVDHIPVR